MIKVPATPQGIPAIRQLVGEGINVNVTLLFALDAYERAAHAYIAGLEAKREGGVRIVACYLPVKSPWLNAIEPKWAYGKKAVVEPDRLLSAEEVRERVWACYGCAPEPPLVQQTGKKVA